MAALQPIEESDSMSNSSDAEARGSAGDERRDVCPALADAVDQAFAQALVDSAQRGQYAAQADDAGSGHPCPLCILRAFDRKSRYRKHLKEDHDGECHCTSSKQLKLLHALWSESCAATVAQTLVAK